MRSAATHFPLLGEPLALDLANTVVRHAGQDLDLLTDERQLRDWLDQQQSRLPAAQPTKAVLAAVRRVRGSVRDCLLAVRDGREPPADAIAELNAVAAAAPATIAIELDPDGRPRRVTQRPAAAADQIGAALAEAAIEFLTESDLDRLRECASDECILLFYAANPRRRWCSTARCGNRERVRRHYQRHHR